MASGNPLFTFLPDDNTPPGTLHASKGWIVGASTPAENFPVLAFNDTIIQYADFHFVLPNHYGGGGITLQFAWAAAAATNNGVWAAAFRRIADDADDLDTTAHTYVYQTTADLTPPSVVGEVVYDDLVFTDGAQIDNLLVNEQFVLRVKRPAPSGTKITGDQRLLSVAGRET